MLVKKVKYRPVEKREDQIAAGSKREDEIIEDIAGPDQTKGSCSSMALTFIANLAGYKVYDFRGGLSLTIFAKNDTVQSIGKIAGVNGIKEDDVTLEQVARMLKKLKRGKYYDFTYARHAAVVRNTKNGPEYLELQGDSWDNKWKPFVNEREEIPTIETRLVRRFGAKEQYLCTATLVDAEELANSIEFREIMGYINNAKELQKKGEGGGIK